MKKREVVWELKMDWEGTGGRAETRQRTKQPSSDHSSQRISRPSQVELVGMQAAPRWCFQDSGLCPPAAKGSTWGPEIMLLMQHCGEPVPSAWNYKSPPEKYILVWCPGNMFGTGYESTECGTCWDSTERLCKVLGLLRQIWAILSIHLVGSNFWKELLQETNLDFMPEESSWFTPKEKRASTCMERQGKLSYLTA